MLSKSPAFRPCRCTGHRAVCVRVVSSSGGFGKKAPQKAQAEPSVQPKVAVLPASVDPKKGWRSLGEQAQLFEAKPVKGVEVPGKAVAVYLHKDKVYCR